MNQKAESHYQYIETLLKLALPDLLDSKLLNILELFSVFISQNEDFKYNKTYLSDSIEDFKGKLLTLHTKKRLIENIIKDKDNIEIKDDWYIIFDDIFVFDTDYSLKTILEIEKQVKALLRYFGDFNLYNIEENRMLIRVVNIQQHKDYVKIFRIKKNSGTIQGLSEFFNFAVEDSTHDTNKN